MRIERRPRTVKYMKSDEKEGAVCRAPFLTTWLPVTTIGIASYTIEISYNEDEGTFARYKIVLSKKASLCSIAFIYYLWIGKNT